MLSMTSFDISPISARNSRLTAVRSIDLTGFDKDTKVPGLVGAAGLLRTRIRCAIILPDASRAFKNL